MKSKLVDYKKRISLIYKDIKFVLLSNLEALIRDGRTSLKELFEARVAKTKKDSINPIDLYKTLVSLDKEFDGEATEFETFGLS